MVTIAVEAVGTIAKHADFLSKFVPNLIGAKEDLVTTSGKKMRLAPHRRKNNYFLLLGKVIIKIIFITGTNTVM